jgi:cyclic pyranopterin phosphate synthase
MAELTHFDERGSARMVDVSQKRSTQREAVARGSITMKKKTLRLIKDKGIEKGDVLGVARVAGIMAAKKTSEIIPMCHPLPISSVTIDFGFDNKYDRINIVSRVKIRGQTGVEMEALTAVAAAALTIYDMCKSVDREMVISDILLLEKKGGKSGLFKRERQPEGAGRSTVPSKTVKT